MHGRYLSGEHSHWWRQPRHPSMNYSLTSFLPMLSIVPFGTMRGGSHETSAHRHGWLAYNLGRHCFEEWRDIVA